MGVLSQIEPQSVFRYFEEICAIPHGSGNTRQISEYCVKIAKEHGLAYLVDSSNNVIIFKDGTKGCEQSDPVILQGHLDMVCEKEPDCEIDFEKDGLSVCVRDGSVLAEGTTLGGDDGIAVAFALAILTADDLVHPPLEVVLTTDEEIGMIGAANLDCAMLKSRVMLNLDSEEEGILLVSCAGGISAVCHLPVSFAQSEGIVAELNVSGLLGGHSGVEIDKGRANANCLLGRALKELSSFVSYDLIAVSGGLKDNAIPREAIAKFVVASEDVSAVRTSVEKCAQVFAKEYLSADPGISLTVSFGERGRYKTMDDDAKDRTVAALADLPYGVLRMSEDIPGLVQTSLNPGILDTTDEEVVLTYSVRSSVGAEKDEVIADLTDRMKKFGGTVQCAGDYPAWEYKRDSKLRDLMIEIFQRQYGRRPQVQAIHAGLECGIFAGKIPGLDCVSFGPDIKDIHTTSERMDIASVLRTWNYVVEILRCLA